MGKVVFRNQFDVVKEHVEKARTSQVSRLGFVSLSDRITSMLKHGKLIVQDLKDAEAMYDEQEGSWNDKEPNFDPTNDISIDKMDAYEMVNQFEESVKESSENAKALGKKGNGGPQVQETTVPSNGTVKAQESEGE